MNNVGVYGKLNFQLTDLDTGTVIDEDILNLVTNYGLGRLFAPRESNEKIANRIYIGKRSEAPSITDDVIPSNWMFVNITSVTIANPDSWDRYSNYSVMNTFLAEGILGTPETVDKVDVDYAYLAYVGEDGIPHALTSFRLRDPSTPIKVGFSKVNVTYKLAVSYPAMATVDGVSGLKSDPVGNSIPKQSIPLNMLYEKNAFRPNGVLSESTDNYAIPMEGVWDDLTGIYHQKYKLIIKNASANTSQKYWFGPTMISFTVATPGEYEMTMEISRVNPDIDATPVTKISKWNSGYLKIEAAPHQQVFVKTVTEPATTLDSAYVGIDGIAYVGNYANYYNSGKTYTFLTVAANGTYAAVNLTTPDEVADPLVAFYRVGPNTMRAIGNRGDSVTIKLKSPFTDNFVYHTIPNAGTCETPSIDEPGYYYCDIDIDPDLLSHEKCKDIHYTNTDLAGNVYEDQAWMKSYRLRYIPDAPYTWYKAGGGQQTTSKSMGESEYDEDSVARSTEWGYEIMEFTAEII